MVHAWRTIGSRACTSSIDSVRGEVCSGSTPGAYGGMFGAIHGIDVAASFHAVRDTFFAGHDEGRTMADRLTATWVAFARTGDPNNDLLPDWPAYDGTRRATMVFDNDCAVVDDPRGEIRRYFDQFPLPTTPLG